MENQSTGRPRGQATEALLTVMQAVSAEMNLDRLLQLIMAKTSEVLGAERSTLFLLDARRGELWSRVAQGAGLQEIRLPVGQGIAGSVAATGETVNIPDAYADPRFNPEVDRRTGYRTRTILCMPVRNREQRLIGVIQSLNKREGVFTPEDEGLLQAFLSQAVIGLENAGLVTELERRMAVTGKLLAVMQAVSAEMNLDRLLLFCNLLYTVLRLCSEGCLSLDLYLHIAS